MSYPEFKVSAAEPEVPVWLRPLVWCRDEARASCADTSWVVRIPLLVFFAYVLVCHWTIPEYGNFLFNGINFGFHELGHVVFRPFGEFLMVAGGTILQCLMPVIAAVVFVRAQRDWFGVAFCLGWLGTNCFHCAIYCSDARGMLNLPLFGLGFRGWGADGVGDWSRMLGTLGLLEWDQTFAFAWRVVGSLCMLAGIAFGAWLLWEMHRWQVDFQRQREERFQRGAYVPEEQDPS